MRFYHIIFFAFCSLYGGDPSEVLIIGAQKSGTGAFYKLLLQHPQVANRPGEIHFFDINFQRGIEWYRDQFPKRGVRIDKSPYYLFHPLCAERAYSVIPKVKLIVLLRNPIDRAFSQYQMNIRKGREKLSFKDALKAEQERLDGQEERVAQLTLRISNHRHYSYLARGLYAKQLRRWLKYYSFQQMLIISFDDFIQNPVRVLQEALVFMGLPPYSNFDFRIGTKHQYPQMDAVLREELADYFRPHNRELELLLNRNFFWE